MDTRPPLHLYLFAHPKSEAATRLAANLMQRFVEPPASGGLRIPVFFTPDLGGERPVFDDDWARQYLPDSQAVLDLYKQQGVEVRTLAQIGADITVNAKAGLAQALNNGLTETENRELMSSADAQRIATLVLTGLGRL